MSWFHDFLMKTEMMQESNLSKFKAEVQSAQVFLNYVSSLRIMILVHVNVMAMVLLVNMLG